jgi:hypothetical protein
MNTRLFYRIQAALGLVYVCAGGAKLLGADIMVEAFDVTGLGQSLRIAVGVLEVCGGVCLFVPRASIYAAMVLGCTIVGILGATVGHMARLGIEQPALERPQLTVAKTYRASLQAQGPHWSMQAPAAGIAKHQSGMES